MLQLGSGAAAASTMLRCSAPFFLLGGPVCGCGAKFAFYPLIPPRPSAPARDSVGRVDASISSISTLPSAPSAQRAPHGLPSMCPARWVLERCRRFHLCDLRLSVAP